MSLDAKQPSLPGEARVMIGLETHVQLNPKSKLLCPCRNPATLGEEPEPNTLTCPACLGLPGSKPRLNEKAVEQALAIALALGCTIPRTMLFSRKTYFYPDMPKNFQITQYEFPLGERGGLSVEGRPIRIRRIHLEEDPARLVHKGGLGGETLADYNRAGVPLVEIVTEPDFASPKEARLYLQKLALILEYLGAYHPASRAIIKSDANVSLSRSGSPGSRVEVKNITGTKEIEQALSYEMVRQSSLLRKGQTVARETRTWNPDLGITQELRSKEEEEEYGYIFEPDLTPIQLPRALLKRIRKSLPELPDARYRRLISRYKLPPKVAESLVSEADLASLFERLSKTLDPRLAGSWLAGYLKKTLNYHQLTFRESGIRDEWLSWLLDLFRQGKITDRNAELTIRKMVEERVSPKEIVKKYNYLVRRFDIDLILRKLLKEHPQAVQDYQAGQAKALHFLVGQAMKETAGAVDANALRQKLLKLLKGA